MKKVDQVYCVNDYWCDYPRRDRVKIDNVKILTTADKKKLRNGNSVSKPDRNGTYTQHYKPILYNNIID